MCEQHSEKKPDPLSQAMRTRIEKELAARRALRKQITDRVHALSGGGDPQAMVRGARNLKALLREFQNLPIAGHA